MPINVKKIPSVLKDIIILEIRKSQDLAKDLGGTASKAEKKICQSKIVSYIQKHNKTVKAEFEDYCAICVISFIANRARCNIIGNTTEQNELYSCDTARLASMTKSDIKGGKIKMA